MYIGYLRLDNFIGIWNGMSKTTVEVNFNLPYSDEHIKRNVITMLSGANGSGKTTILSMLHPFMDSQDNRKNLILPEKEGYKEIHIYDNNNKYNIRHYYKNKGNKSYIEKNGEELNRNGGIKTFKELVKEELDVTEDFFKIGRIGSNVTNFIDFSTAERKTYISKFLPDIEDYLHYFKVVNEKFKKLKKEVNYIAEQIQKLDSKENLETLKESLWNQKNDKEGEINSTFAVINKNEGRISNIDEDGSLSEDGNPYKEDYNSAKIDLKRSEREMSKYIEKYSQLESYDLEKTRAIREKSSGKLIGLKKDLDAVELELNGIRQKIVEISNDKKKKETNLKELKKGESLEELKSLVEEKEISLKELAEEIANRNSKFKKYDVSRNSIVSVKSTLEQAKESVLDTKANYGDDYIDTAMTLIDRDKFNESSLREALRSAKMTKMRIEDNINHLNRHIAILDSNAKQAESLKMRPDACRIDSCDFIRSALKHKNAESDMIEKQKLVDDAKDQLKNQDSVIEFNEEMLQLYTVLANSYRGIERGIGVIQRLPLGFVIDSFSSYCRLITKPNMEIENLFDLSDLISYLEDKDTYSIEREKVQNAKEKLQILVQQSSMVEMIENEVKEFEEAIESLENDEDEASQRKDEIQSGVDKESAKVTILVSLEELLTIQANSTAVVTNLREKYENTEKLLETLDNLLEDNKLENRKMDRLKRELEPIVKKLDETNLRLAKLQEYELRKESLENDYSTIETIKNALDPNKGIPLHFIGGYLKETANISNNLLDLAYSGKFRISFKIDEKDFFIRVLKENGDILPDIGDASQGETALTTISLSMAMIQQAMTRYNIISLDEIDSTLDANNRANFIDMLETQIEALGLEQVFVISHNNQFDAYPVDLVVLNGSTVDRNDEQFMSNKNVVFDITNQDAQQIEKEEVL